MDYICIISIFWGEKWFVKCFLLSLCLTAKANQIKNTNSLICKSNFNSNHHLWDWNSIVENLSLMHYFIYEHNIQAKKKSFVSETRTHSYVKSVLPHMLYAIISFLAFFFQLSDTYLQFGHEVENKKKEKKKRKRIQMEKVDPKHNK